MVQGYSSQISSCPYGGSSFSRVVCHGSNAFGSKGNVRIMMDIRMSNGIHIQQRNLDYEGLKCLP